MEITETCISVHNSKVEYFQTSNKPVSSFRNSCNGVKRNPLKIKESFEPSYLLNNLDNEPCVECTTMNTHIRWVLKNDKSKAGVALLWF